MSDPHHEMTKIVSASNSREVLASFQRPPTTRANAWKIGAIIHGIAAVVFAILYTLLIIRLGYSNLPSALAVGAGIGLGHGLIVSLGLVWVVAERHPLEEFADAGLAIGLSHILGHVAYGAVVGLVIGIAAI